LKALKSPETLNFSVNQILKFNAFLHAVQQITKGVMLQIDKII